MFRQWAVATVVLGLVWCAACEKKPRNGADSATSSRPATGAPTTVKPPAPRTTERVKYTSENNPTTRAGRGQPDLLAGDRPAAWLFIDGFEGEYRSEDGKPLLQWFIDGPVSSTPVFRLEVYEPLLGEPRDFQCALQSNDPNNPMIYAIKAKEGTFQVGQDYSLLRPGENFTILNKLTNEKVSEIPPLPPGPYGLAAGIRRTERDAAGEITGVVEALAVTYFTVGE